MWPLAAGRIDGIGDANTTPPLRTWDSTVSNSTSSSGDEQPVEHEPEERQLEHVEPDVGVELPVGDAERAAVAEQQPRLPLGGRREGDEDRQHERAAVAQQPQALPEDLVEPLDVRVGVGREARRRERGRR